jgi:hypothetical protein
MRCAIVFAWSDLLCTVRRFAAAVADRAIGVSPCTGVTLPEIPHHRHYIPSDEQVHELSAGLPERYAPVVYVAAGCGLRGHSTPTITLNTYVWEWPDTDRQTRAIVDSALGHVPRMCP